MGRSTTLRILEALADAAKDAADVFAAIVSAGYGAPLSALQREMSKLDRQRAREKREYRAWRNYQTALSRLKKDGLLEVRKKRGRKLFSITHRGKGKLSLLKERCKAELPSTTFPREAGNTFVVVAFDVPERERRKRRWLRAVLRGLGMRMVQKSVWIGKVKLPKEFLDSLHHLGLMGYVEIFAISKTGTLKHVA